MAVLIFYMMLDSSTKARELQGQCHSVAKIINSGMHTKITDDITKSTTDKYQWPENCQNMKVLKINSELWWKLTSTTLSSDIKFENSQALIMKAVVSISSLMEKFTKPNSGLPLHECREWITDYKEWSHRPYHYL